MITFTPEFLARHSLDRFGLRIIQSMDCGIPKGLIIETFPARIAKLERDAHLIFPAALKPETQRAEAVLHNDGAFRMIGIHDEYAAPLLELLQNGMAATHASLIMLQEGREFEVIADVMADQCFREGIDPKSISFLPVWRVCGEQTASDSEEPSEEAAEQRSSAVMPVLRMPCYFEPSFREEAAKLLGQAMHRRMYDTLAECVAEAETAIKVLRALQKQARQHIAADPHQNELAEQILSRIFGKRVAKAAPSKKKAKPTRKPAAKKRK